MGSRSNDPLYPQKADIGERDCHVRFVPTADIGTSLFDHLVGQSMRVLASPVAHQVTPIFIYMTAAIPR